MTGTEKPVLEFVPSKAIPPRADFNPLPDGYVLNPDPVTKADGRETLVTQALNAGGQTATAFRLVTTVACSACCCRSRTPIPRRPRTRSS